MPLENDLQNLTKAVESLSAHISELRRDICGVIATRNLPTGGSPQEREEAAEAKPAKKPARKKPEPTPEPTDDEPSMEDDIVSDAELDAALEEDEAPAPTRDDVKAALLNAQEAAGKTAPRKLMDQFNAQRLSDIKEEDYAAIIAAADALAGE